MKRTGRKKEWSIALFGFSLLAFFPPVLSIFDKPILISGIPLTFMFLFGVWASVIVAMAVGARRRQSMPQDVETTNFSASASEADVISSEPPVRPEN